MQSSLKARRGTIQGRPEAKAAAGHRKGGNGVNLNLRVEMIPGLCVRDCGEEGARRWPLGVAGAVAALCALCNVIGSFALAA